jgi:hypothetical protein
MWLGLRYELCSLLRQRGLLFGPFVCARYEAKEVVMVRRRSAKSHPLRAVADFDPLLAHWRGVVLRGRTRGAQSGFTRA